MQVILFLFASLAISTHELHLSMCAVSYNEEGHRIEVQQRIFYDDLEKSLQMQLNDVHFNILKPQESPLSYDSLLMAYANKHLELYVNDERAELALLEYEISDDAVVLYMFKANVKKLRSIDFFSHVLFEIFDDQDNVVTVQAHGEKKSGKFDVGSKSLRIDYEKKRQ